MCDCEICKASEQHAITGETSDGYHTFNELYEHRHLLFAYMCSNNSGAWKSKMHDDGPIFDDDGKWFVAGVDLPTKTITHHIPIEFWELFKCKILDRAPAWDGHTSKDVLVRLRNYLKESI